MDARQLLDLVDQWPRSNQRIIDREGQRVGPLRIAICDYDQIASQYRIGGGKPVG